MSKILTACLCLFYWMTGTSTSLAQSKGKFKIVTNFEWVYVAVDYNPESLQKVNREEILDLEAGNHRVTIIPRYAPSYEVSLNVKPDSIEVAKIYFRYILDNINASYEKAMAGVLTRSELHKSGFNTLVAGSVSFKTFPMGEYEERKNQRAKQAGRTYLKLISNTDSLAIRFWNKPSKTYVFASGDSVALEPGYHKVTLAHPFAGEWTTEIKVQKNATTKLQHSFNLMQPSISTLSHNIATQAFYHANLVIVSDADSKIIIGNQVVGRGLATYRAETGPVEVKVMNPYTGMHTYTTKITNIPGDKAKVIEAYSKPMRSTSRFSALFPGASQFYKRQRWKGAVLSSSILLMTGLSIYQNARYRKQLTAFRETKSFYLDATSEQQALELGNQMEVQHAGLVVRDRRRKTLLVITAALYAYNLFDGLLNKPKSGYREKTDIRLKLNSRYFQGRNYSTLSFSYDF